MNFVGLAVALWIIAAAAVAMSNTRYHKNFALYLFLPSAIILIPLIGMEFGTLLMLAAIAGVGSVLRWPFYYLGKFIWAKLTGGEFRGPDWRPENHGKPKTGGE